MGIPITALIAGTTIISTIASLAGGLTLYFQSLESLRETVELSSYEEVEHMRSTILPVIDECVFIQRMMKTFFEYPDIVVTLNDSGTTNPNWVNVSKATYDSWETQIRRWTFSAVNTSSTLEDCGMILIPHHDDDPSFLYHHHWYDLKADGSREYVHATVGYNGSKSIEVRQVDVEGAHQRILYNSGLGFYQEDWDSWPNLRGWTPVTNYKRRGFYRYREPLPWYASDSNPYVYMAFEVMLDPPPPPHPWSQYRAVMYQGMFIFDAWEVAFTDLDNLGTIVVLMDGIKEYIYLSSEGQKLFSVDCVELSRVGQLDQLSSCFTRIDNASKVVRDAWGEVRYAKGGVFTSSGSNFVRRHDIFSYTAAIPDAEGNILTSLDATMLWIRPHSSVQRKVDEAVTLLFVFVSLVFTFDIFLALFEMKLVALPVSRASAAVVKIGSMDLEAAARILKKDAAAKCTVSEVGCLIDGLLKAVENLIEFRTFIPDSVLTKELSFISPPEDVVAIVFTDIEGSSQLWEDHSDAMLAALSSHNCIMRSNLITFHGYEVKTMGDAFMVAFQFPKDGINWCIGTQESLLDADWPHEFEEFPRTSKITTPDGKLLWNGLRVRMGIHHGDVTIEINPITGRADYRGGTVNKASRIENIAAPGMIACSSEVLDEVVNIHSISSGIWGTFELKGIGSEVVHFLLSDVLQPRETEYPVIASGRDFRELGSSASSQSRHRSSQTPRSLPPTGRKLSEVNGVVATIEMVHLHKRNLISNDTETRALLGVQGICDTLHATDGRAQSIIGNNVTAGWNILQNCASPLTQAFRFSGIACVRYLVRCGLSQGRLLQGNIGTARRRYHTIVGQVVEDSIEMVRKASELRCEALAAVPGGCTGHLSNCAYPIDVHRTTADNEQVFIELLVIGECSNLRMSWSFDDQIPAGSMYRDLFVSSIKSPKNFEELLLHHSDSSFLNKQLELLRDRGYIIPFQSPVDDNVTHFDENQ